MAESHKPSDEHELKKPYSTPTLTEYGNVSKLTMSKGSTNFELVPKKQRRPCL